MAITGLLSALPWGWRLALCAGGVLLIGGAYGAGHMRGYGSGHAAATAEGNAAYAALERDYARRYADALAHHAARLRREMEKGFRASADLAKAKEEHAKTEQSLRQRVTRITRGSVHRFSPDFVRLFNEAVGADAGPHPGGTVAGTGGASAGAGTGSAAGAGVRGLTAAAAAQPSGKNGKRTAPEPSRASGGKRGTAGMDAAGGAGAQAGLGDEPAAGSGPRPDATGVTERDVLAYIVYYGKRCRDMEAQLRALVRLVGEER